MSMTERSREALDAWLQDMRRDVEACAESAEAVLRKLI